MSVAEYPAWVRPHDDPGSGEGTTYGVVATVVVAGAEVGTSVVDGPAACEVTGCVDPVVDDVGPVPEDGGASSSGVDDVTGVEALTVAVAVTGASSVGLVSTIEGDVDVAASSDPAQAPTATASAVISTPVPTLIERAPVEMPSDRLGPDWSDPVEPDPVALASVRTFAIRRISSTRADARRPDEHSLVSGRSPGRPAIAIS